jgi:predicted dehydrogenase
MTAEPLRAAVIGVGMIGALHARIYQSDPRTRLVGVCDTDEQRARKLGDELGVPAHAGHEQLLDAVRPDVVSVAVPEQARFAPAVAAAEAGCALLLEKPLAPTLDGADRLVAEVERTGARTMVNFILRSDLRYQQVHDAARSGALGQLCTLSARRRGTITGAETYGPWTSLLLSTAIHDLDMMMWVADAPVERVYAEAVVTRSAEWGHEDAVLGTLRFANGVIGSIDTSWVLPAHAPEPLSAALHAVGTGEPYGWRAATTASACWTTAATGTRISCTGRPPGTVWAEPCRQACRTSSTAFVHEPSPPWGCGRRAPPRPSSTPSACPCKRTRRSLPSHRLG